MTRVGPATHPSQLTEYGSARTPAPTTPQNTCIDPVNTFPVLLFGIPLESFRVTNSRVLPLEEASIVGFRGTNRCYSPLK
mmetsp:Transcript_3433/g.6954  ORF Transcript_3433/g.6954 Transcript_3433/m.6954 type:complete len:80 (-) Transcript_3433:63-302(-)